MNKFNKIIMCILNPGFYKAYMNGVAPLFELYPLLNQINQIKTIIDIGSKKGQFLLLGRSIFPSAKIYSFEPQINILNLQKKVLGTKNINYYNFSLGNEEKESELYVTKRKDSSSVLKPILTKNRNFMTNEIKKTSIKRLDDLPNFKNIERPSVMKLDVQGYEFEVLKGAENILDYIDYVITEVSFIEVYENQTSANKLIKFLKSKSFEIKDKCNLSKIEGKLFQEDILFFKS